MKKYAWNLGYLSYREMYKLGAKKTPANQTTNLIKVHQNFHSHIPAVFINDQVIGLTSLLFCRWKNPELKNQKETPYTQQGRRLYQQRTGKASLLPRKDEWLAGHLRQKQLYGQHNSLYTFEYFLNRAYAFNRDKGKCRICGKQLAQNDIDFHHVRPQLPAYMLNRVSNLASICISCHNTIHSTVPPQGSAKFNRKITRMREKLSLESHKVLMERRMRRKSHVRCETREKGRRTAHKCVRGRPLPIVAMSTTSVANATIRYIASNVDTLPPPF
ncbi:HNH endonuclease [Sporomusa acidovorans]|uniref:HNH nuclease domain-containing protein n=1 Tax=Sporomusa acidovorans (strain ATCC 49682 / DSM 3132 / Mol) TaxID=1123286 RepID=A0ABZ3J5P2_SPOA4|nr:HNH endonuclease signature motif containing protein [Sporomusa acidovorans]OZC16921.1 hypothetical protein SPACI_40220 [Sporomusa acidovorans DSM 3132]SDF75508.1 HNH endonuclease [Sporomusa acidovorans]